ncbi:MAG TPA: threonine synthase [Ktedonobacterales bacterium]
MRYFSVNGGAPVSFREAALSGLARDGGLFLPETIPTLGPEVWAELAGASLQDIAFALARALLGGDIPDDDLRAIVDGALDFPIPLVTLDAETRVLELFHGPTLAFKDVGARFMARVFAWLQRGASQPFTVLVATSGDTGGAVASGFGPVPGARVVLLYPRGRVSPLQERQLTTGGPSVTALAVDGAFDDCQRLVKEAFRDADVRAWLTLTSANSINITRLLPQTFSYAWAWAQLDDRSRPLIFSVPSGNLGNLTAGLIARRMGLPIARFIAAANANGGLTGYLAGAEPTPHPSLHTLSNAMDVGDPSNLTRILALYGHDRAALAREVSGYTISDTETLDAMRALNQLYGYTADPHTAVGYAALERDRATRPEAQTAIVLATAHPAKFPDVCERALGHPITLPERLRATLDRTPRITPLANSYAALRAVLLDES